MENDNKNHDNNVDDSELALCWRSVKMMFSAMFQGPSESYLQDEKHSERKGARDSATTTSSSNHSSTFALREWSTDQYIESQRMDRGKSARSSRRDMLIIEPICVDDYLPIESPYTDIDLGTILESRNGEDEEGVEIDVDANGNDSDDESLLSVDDIHLSSSSLTYTHHYGRVEGVVQHLLQRQDEICEYMGDSIMMTAPSTKSYKKKHHTNKYIHACTAGTHNNKKAQELLEHQKRISILFAESVRKFAKQLDRKVYHSKRQSEVIKRLKAELASVRTRTMSDAHSVKSIQVERRLSYLDADDREQSTQPVSVADHESDHHDSNDYDMDDGSLAARDELERMVQEKEQELHEAQDVIEDLVEQLREAEQEIEFSVQRERESALAMQALLNCKIADQRGEIDELKEQLEHKTIALKKAEKIYWISRSRRERSSSKRAMTSYDDMSVSTTDLSESMADTSESAAESSESMEDSSESSVKDLTLRFY